MNRSTVERTPGLNFNDVDGADLKTHVDFLQNVWHCPAIQAYKQFALEQLDLHEGDYVLDVGCGIGLDTVEIAKRVGPNGLALGIDSSKNLVAAAKSQAARISGVSIRFDRVDGHDMSTFPHNFFHVARTDRTLQHIENPLLAVQQMAKVVRPEGIVQATEPDWATLVISNPIDQNPTLTQAIVDFYATRIRNPYIGRQLRGIFKEANLDDISVVAFCSQFNSYQEANTVLRFVPLLDDMIAKDKIERRQGQKWAKSLSTVDDGAFYASLNFYIVQGRKNSH